MKLFDEPAYRQQGYWLARGVLDHELDLNPVLGALTARLDELEVLSERASVTSTARRDLNARLMALFDGSPGDHAEYVKWFDLSLPLAGVTQDSPVWLAPALFDLMRSPRLLDAVSALVGDEIVCNPVQHARLKPPGPALAREDHDNGMLGRTPWHQDGAVLTPEAQSVTEMVTAWIPLTPATERTGCLRVVPNSHRFGLLTSAPGPVDGLMIVDDRFEATQAISVPAEVGDVLFLHRHMAHASLPNTSDEVRISLDLRYQPASQPTGREQFPAFVARSACNPASELASYDGWRASWEAARARLASEARTHQGQYAWLGARD